MSTTYKQKGEVINTTNGSGADVSAGDVLVQGDVIRVAVVDIANGSSGAAYAEGVHTLAAKSADTWSDGDVLYWDATAENLTTTVTDNVHAGVAVGDKAALATTADVKINVGTAPLDALSFDDAELLKFGDSDDITMNFDGTNFEIEGAAASTAVLIGADSKLLNVTLKGTLTVGVDDTGHDVIFYGATSGKSFTWDESADAVILAGDLTQTGDLTLTGALDVTGNSQFTGTVTVGVDDTGHDVKFFGATSGSYLLWDESADQLIINAGSADLGSSCEADAYTVGGTAGVDFGPAAPASLTVVKGIVTAASS